MSAPITAVALILLNLVDAIMTLIYIQAGVAREANPIMATALDGGALGFMLVKIGIVSVSVVILISLIRHRAAGLALTAGAGVYALLVVYQLTEVPRLI